MLAIMKILWFYELFGVLVVGCRDFDTIVRLGCVAKRLIWEMSVYRIVPHLLALKRRLLKEQAVWLSRSK
jgi:hypothetical protein